MLRYREHLVIVLSVFILTRSPVAAWKETEQEALSDHWQPPRDPPRQDFVPSTEQRTRFKDFGGQDAVHATWHGLQKLENAQAAQSKSTTSQAFAETIWRYLKIVFRLLFVNGPTKDHVSSAAGTSFLSGGLLRKVNLLKHAAALDDPDSIFLLAEMNFYGNFSVPRDYHQAFNYYSQLASVTGNSTAQYMLGFFYATGIGGAVDRHQGKSLMYHTFAAEQGNIRSEMTLAFQYHSGIGTARDCDKAAHFYKRVSDKSIAYWKSGPPGGRDLVKESYRWADESGGVYGEGASVSSSGSNVNRDGSNSASADDVQEYLDMLARKGDLKATFSLAKMHYSGSKTNPRKFRTAQRLFMKITRQYWDKHGKVIPGGVKGIDKIAAKAAAYIGRMYLRGEGLDQSYQTAANWFRRGIENGDPHSQYFMGVMYRDGLGVPKDSFKAADYFRASADEDFPAAQSSLGVLFLDQGEVETAGRYFELAARHRHPEAFYYIAELTNKGIGRERHCGTATTSYKIAVESIEQIHSSFREANEAYGRGDLESAVVASMMAAEQGYETAQANVAYLMDEQTPALHVPSIPILISTARRVVPSLRDAALALTYWTRSAKQGNIDSLLKMGDYYLSTLGVSAPDPDKTSTCYHTAAEVYHSAQASWNLGWMHENGVAVVQDFHMAKRYYDLALEMNSEAYLPVKLALVKLRIRSYWNTIIGGDVTSIHAEADAEFDDDEEAAKNARSLTFSQWIRKFKAYASDEDHERDDAAAMRGGGSGLDDATLGNNNDGAVDGGDDDSSSSSSSYYYEDNADVDDGLLETLIIIGLAATLAFLVYYRNQHQLRQQQQQQQRQFPEGGERGNNAASYAAPGQGPGPRPTGGVAVGAAAAPATERAGGGAGGAEDGGFFPNPGDPDWPAWTAGGIGH